MRDLLRVIDRQSRWDHLRVIGNSRLVKLTILVPLLGYMVLFNEQLVHYLELASPYFRDVFLHGRAADGETWSLAYRLYCFYFGFTALAIGALVYEARCPRLVKAYGSAAEYYRVEGPTTDDHQLQLRAIPYLTRLFRDECRQLGLSVKEVWLAESPAGLSFRSEEDEQKAKKLHNKMLQTINEQASGIDRKAWVMKSYFVPLKSAHPVSRWTAVVFYYLGFAILTVPTIHSFLSVVLTVANEL